MTGPKGTLELQVPNGCTCDEVSRCHLLMIDSVIIKSVGGGVSYGGTS